MFASEAICIADIFVCLFEFPVKGAMNTAFIRQKLCFYLPLDLFVYVYVYVCWCVCVPTTILYLPVTNIQTKATEEKRQKHNQICSSSIYSLSLCTGISREKKKSI